MTRQRMGIAAAAVVLEYLVFSLLFDARDLLPFEPTGLGDLAALPLIAAAALFMQSGATAVTVLPPAPPLDHRPRVHVVLWVVAHLAAFGAFLFLSARLRAEVQSGAGDRSALILLCLWAGTALLTLVLWAATFTEASRLRALASRGAWPLGLGGVVGLAAWAAGRQTGAAWEPWSQLTLQPVAAVIGLLSPDRVLDAGAHLVGTARFAVRIAPQCAGYEGAGLVGVLTCGYLWTHRRELRFPRALLLLLAGLAAAFLANVVRIVALIYVGTLLSPEIAVGGFHSKAGWLLFCGVALSVTWAAHGVGWFRHGQRPFEASDAGEVLDAGEPAPLRLVDDPSAVYLGPLLAFAGATLVCGLLAGPERLDRLDGIPVGIALVAVCVWWRNWRVGRTLSWSWTACGAGVAAFFVWMLLDVTPPHATAEVQQTLEDWPRTQAAAWVVTRALGSVLVVPLFEEIAFRGFLLRRLTAPDFTAVSYRGVSAFAVVASSLAFAALHERFVSAFVCGLLYALAARARGRLLDAVVAHAVTNGLIAWVVLFTGRWSLWA